MKKGYSHITFLLDNSGSMETIKESTIGGFNEFLAKQKLEPGLLTFSLWEFTYNRNVVPQKPAPVKPVETWHQPTFGELTVGPLLTHNTVAIPLTHSSIASMNAASYPLFNGIAWQSDDVVDGSKLVYDTVPVAEIPALSSENYKCFTGTPLLDTIVRAINDTGVKLAASPESERPENVYFVILTDGRDEHSIFATIDTVNQMITHQREVYNWQFIFLGANQDAIRTAASYGISAASSMTYATNDASVGATYNALSATVSASRSLGVQAAFTDQQRSEVLGGK